MDLKRRLSLVVAIMSVALASGHLVQNVLVTPAAALEPSVDLRPVGITLVAAGSDVVVPYLAPAKISLPSPSFAVLPETGNPNLFVLPDDPVITVELGTTATGAVTAADTCAISLDLLAEPSAMIGVTLLAPCRANQRVVLRHDGLAVTGKTSANGALFVSLPALAVAATVSARFNDGKAVEAAIAVPDMAQLRRFGVQWTGDDAFQLHAFETGGDYGDPGHVSAADPQLPDAGKAPAGGYLSVLGDEKVEAPMLAEVYTYPVDPAAPVRIVVEAAVTKNTCAREILGETIADVAGSVTVTELTLTMPDCGAVGDILVLNNLDPDLKIAAAN